MVDMKKKLPIWRVAQHTLRAYRQASLTQQKRKKLEEALNKKIQKVDEFKSKPNP